MYKSPIEINTQPMVTQLDNDILKVVQSYDILVDKEELLRALKYDRDQYDKGYQDGVAFESGKTCAGCYYHEHSSWYHCATCCRGKSDRYISENEIKEAEGNG